VNDSVQAAEVDEGARLAGSILAGVASAQLLITRIVSFDFVDR